VFAGYYSVLTNVKRHLGAQIETVIDALSTGGSGDPFTGLTSAQRHEVALLLRYGFPRSAASLLRHPSTETMLYSWVIRDLKKAEQTYFTKFWTKPGYAGHDEHESLQPYVIDESVSVTRVLNLEEVMALALGGNDTGVPPTTVQLVTLMGGGAPMVVEIDRPLGKTWGSCITVSSGKAAGRTLYALDSSGRFVIASPTGSPQAALAFTDVVPGDELHLDNRDHVAYGYYYRHHITNDWLTVDGIPIYPQGGVFPWPHA
jgi:hypothetical protein